MGLSILESVRTNNFNDPNILAKMGGLWTKHQQTVTNEFKEGYAVFCIYHKYNSNYQGDYTASLSIFTDTEKDSTFDCSKEQFVEYPVDTKQEQAVFETWKKIWEDEAANLIHRAYHFDIEQYNPDGTIVIKINVK